MGSTRTISNHNGDIGISSGYLWLAVEPAIIGQLMGEDQRLSMVENKPCLKPPAKNEFLVRRSLFQIPKLRIDKTPLNE